MHHLWIPASCLAVLLALGVTERLLRDRARRAIPIRVHVNGIRGKSTVTRLIWAALTQAGVRAVAKTTGTVPRLITPDGRERTIRRRAPAAIREQLWLLRVARRERAAAVVAECMAIEPDLQWVSEHQMIGATIGVITNVRTDHTEVLGRTVEAIADCLGRTIPRGGVLIIGDERVAGRFEKRARALGSRLVVARPAGAESGPTEAGGSRDLPENEAVALAVTRELGIADDVARAGMRAAPPDPGAARDGTVAIEMRTVRWVDLTAANDPESLDILLARWSGDSGEASRLFVYNHRADRPGRLEAFSAHENGFARAAAILLTGDRPPLSLQRSRRHPRAGPAWRFVRPRRLANAIRTCCRSDRIDEVIFCGNTRRFSTAALLDELANAG